MEERIKVTSIRKFVALIDGKRKITIRRVFKTIDLITANKGYGCINKVTLSSKRNKRKWDQDIKKAVV